MPQQKWFARLRGQIKDRCGLGWGIADRNGDTQLTRRINDGKQHQNPRQSVQLGVPWNPACSGDIFLKVCQLKQLVDERHCSLAEAKKKLDAKDSATPTITRSVASVDAATDQSLRQRSCGEGPKPVHAIARCLVHPQGRPGWF